MTEIFGYEFEDIKAMRQKKGTRKRVDVNVKGDYGADPIGDGTFRMVPSGDIVDFAERNRRLDRR